MSMQNLELPVNVQIVEGATDHLKGEIVPVPTPVTIVNAPVKKREFYAALSEIQAELEDLQTILASIRKGKTIIPTYAGYIDTTRENLHSLMAFINSTDVPEDVQNHLHILRHLNNAWEQMLASPLINRPNASFDLLQQLNLLDLLDDQIHSFNYQISLLSIPHQIVEWLRITGPGYFIPFHEVFASDVPSSEDRDRLLKYIALTPALTPGGFVDIESGRIYRFTTNRWRRIQSVAMLVLSLGITTGIVAAASLLRVQDWPLESGDLPKMLVAWAAILIGVGVHILVGSTKRAKTQNGMPPVFLDLITIINARFREIVMKLILGLVGLFGLVIVSAMPQLGPANLFPSLQITPINAFLVGYSLDSILELFGTSMEGTSQVKSLIKPK